MSCEDCFKTVPHVGTPVGRTQVIAGIRTYVSEPRNATQKKILLYFSDVFGPYYLNNQLIQDWFANKGYTVLGLDYFFGDDFDALRTQPGFDRPTWVDKSFQKANEHTPAWVGAVRQHYGTTDVKYFAAGFCFGAPFVFSLANDPKFNLAAGAVAHPSRLYDPATQQIKADVFENCVAPIAFAFAETDAAFPIHARRQAEDILVKNKVRYYMQAFSGVSHGFASRGDPADGDQRFAKEECARGFLHWFDRFAA